MQRFVGAQGAIRMKAFKESVSRVLLLVGVVALVAACGKEAGAPAGRPPVDVTTITVAPRDTPVSFEFVGQTESSREVEIRARVEGFLEKRLYKEGELVQAGQPMFQMDRKPFEAALQSARGQLAQQRAALSVAVADLARVKPLAAQNALSPKDLDQAVGNEEKAKAAVFAAEGQVQTAELNLGYTSIASPLRGLASSAKLQEGAYISAGNNLLTYVAQMDPIWINFSISENELLRFREQAAKGLLRLPKNNDYDVKVVLADGSIYPSRGKVSFSDPSFSKDTGTFQVRSVFANPKGLLRPGQFVRVEVEGSERPNAILVPQRAVQQGAKAHFVWLVDKEGKATERVVDIGDWNGDNWFVNQGLAAGDQVVVDGAIRVSQGAPLKVSPVPPPAPEAGATGKPAAEAPRDTAKAAQ
jgi:membrane fusion protein (multidrug efflux system)